MSEETPETKEVSSAAPFELRRIVSCCRCLGLKNGIRYWRLQRRAEKNPELVELWCELWLKGAEEEEAKGNHIAAGVLRAFVKDTRELNIQS